MRRCGVSAWVLAERNRVRTPSTRGVASRLADGENPIAAWRIETGLSTRQLDRKTRIAVHRSVRHRVHVIDAGCVVTILVGTTACTLAITPSALSMSTESCRTVRGQFLMPMTGCEGVRCEWTSPALQSHRYREPPPYQR